MGVDYDEEGSAEAGISRQWLHKIINEVMEDLEGKYVEAVKEASFRREMRDILAKRGKQG